MSDHFWMVYGRGQRGPAVEHMTREIAEAEARRLARVEPDTPFFVLESIARVEKVDIRVTPVGPAATTVAQKQYSGWKGEALGARL